MKTLIVGCGYVGSALARRLAADGHEVFGVRRPASESDDTRAEPGEGMNRDGFTLIRADVTKPDSFRAFPAGIEWLVHCVSSSRGGTEAYEAVYVEGTRHLVAHFQATGLKKFVLTSSTSVYGQTDALPVKETSPTEPASQLGRLLVEGERCLLEATRAAQFPAVILRVAGIYGPGRGHLFHQYLRNEARITGKGDRYLNMIHLDDLVSCIHAALRSGRPGEIYNAVDDEPVAQIHFFRWLSETLGKWMPPVAAEGEVTGRKRPVTNKRVQNRKLKMELGVVLRYPTFRQGYTAEIQRLDAAGELNLQPESRDQLTAEDCQMKWRPPVTPGEG